MQLLPLKSLRHTARRFAGLLSAVEISDQAIFTRLKISHCADAWSINSKSNTAKSPLAIRKGQLIIITMQITYRRAFDSTFRS